MQSYNNANYWYNQFIDPNVWYSWFYYFNTLERGSVTVGAGSTTLILQFIDPNVWYSWFYYFNSLERGNLSAYVIDPGICCMGMQQVDE